LKKTALITGISGQDGAYLSEKLISDCYTVFGISRDPSPQTNWRLRHLGLIDHPNLHIIKCDLAIPQQTNELISDLKPAEVYNLASHSFVSNSQNFAYQTAMVSGIAALNLLEAISKKSPHSKFVQAGSSELFGNAEQSHQNEHSRFRPINVYASAKLFAHSVVLNYRDNLGIFAANAILYNHESPLRDEQFVTRRISQAVAQISKKNLQKLEIGNLSATRDWGYAPEYAMALRQVLNHSEPDTFVIATGRATTVREFVRLAFEVVGIEVFFEGTGKQERGIHAKTGREIVSINSQFYRDAEQIPLLGNPSKAAQMLGWKAETSVEQTVRLMVEADLARIDLD
jgi:GDPmannose 4,6-dehydratase